MEITRITQVNLKLANALALAWMEWWKDLVEPYKNKEVMDNRKGGSDEREN
jgi:hypothetical protein